jgi:P4 family phage/plasmid primase-like protien
MDTSFEELLKHHRADTLFFSHGSMIQPLGTFEFGRQQLDEEFWPLYCDLIHNTKDAIVGITEKPQEYLPVLGDIDICIKEEDNIFFEDNIYTEDQVIQVIQCYQSVLRNILEGCTDQDLTCVLLEKPMYIKTQNGSRYFKKGFHIHLPYIFLSKTDQKTQLNPRVQALVKEEEIFKNLGFEDSGSVIDSNACTVNWLLYGSRKKEDMEPYKVTKIYNSECEEISIEQAFRNYRIFNYRNLPINIKDNIYYHLPRILSILSYGRDIYEKELRSGLVSPIKEQNKKRESKINMKVSVTDALKLSERLLPILANSRAENHNDWMYVGWVLYNIGEGCDQALQQWLKFSARCEDKYDESRCIYEWEHMTKKHLSLGSLRYFAKIDNPIAYAEFVKINSDVFLNESINGSHNDIAKVLYEEYSEEFVCASTSKKIWYRFNDHKWELEEDGNCLRERISNEIKERFVALMKEKYTKLGGTSDKVEESIINDQIKKIQKIVTNLKTSPYKSNIMRECCEVFYDKKFRDKLNVNPYLIGFKNGVYDLKLNTFRPGRPEDYLTKCMNVEYKDYLESDEIIQEVYTFLEKVFPDKSIRNYFMNQASDVFVGGNQQKIAVIWTGEGDNAKSVTQTLFEKMLGPYAVKLPTTVLTGKKVGAGSANADLARTGDGTRWVVAEEPDGDEKINSGPLKHLTGNDTYFVRDLYEGGKETKETTPLFKLVIICNKLPHINNADQAVWNRIRVIPFESTFCRPSNPAPESYEEQLRQKRFPMDPNFSEKIPALVPAFAWVLLKHRLSITSRHEPEKVLEATANYRKSCDIYRQFLEEKIVEDKKSKISLGELCAEIRDWWKEGFPGTSIPGKNDIKEYFTKLWGESEAGFKWTGYRTRTIQDDEKKIEDENTKDKEESDVEEIVLYEE